MCNVTSDLKKWEGAVVGVECIAYRVYNTRRGNQRKCEPRQKGPESNIIHLYVCDEILVVSENSSSTGHVILG